MPTIVVDLNMLSVDAVRSIRIALMVDRVNVEKEPLNLDESEVRDISRALDSMIASCTEMIDSHSDNGHDS